MAEAAFLDHAPPIAFAHRGFARDGDENSMAAFERAVTLGYSYLETDVRVTADGVALAFHDARLDRVTDAHGRVEALPWITVRQARIAGREPIPLLSDVLAAWPHVRVNVDVKCDAAVSPTVAAIRRTASMDRVCVGAFTRRRIAAVRRALGPRLCTSLAPDEALRLRLVGRARLEIPRRLASLAGRCAQVPARIGRTTFVDGIYVAAAHQVGAVVHVWTVNDPAEMTRLLDLGVDGLMTDRADVLRELLQARGEWRARADGRD